MRLSFGGTYDNPADIEGDIIEQLESAERRYGLGHATTSDTGPRRLRSVLDRLYQSSGPGVWLCWWTSMTNRSSIRLKTLKKAKANREYLRGFYGIIKDSARQVHFVFVTGVSMFSKVSLFSGLNNLEDISLDPNYGTICGYTEDDLDRVFAPELSGLDRDQIRKWYNGYNWLGSERVYNPFGLLLLFPPSPLPAPLVQDRFHEVSV